MNPTRNHGVVGLIPGLAWWVKNMASPWAVVQVAGTAQIPCCCSCGIGWQLLLWLDPSPGNLYIQPQYTIYNPKKKKKKSNQWLAVFLLKVQHPVLPSESDKVIYIMLGGEGVWKERGCCLLINFYFNRNFKEWKWDSRRWREFWRSY